MEDDEDDGEAMAEPATIEELEAEWAANRAEIIETINAEGWGVNEDNVLVGPGGFEIDLNNCPADWLATAADNSGPRKVAIPSRLNEEPSVVLDRPLNGC